MNPNTLKIIQLRAENVKRLSAVEITPKGDLVIVAGKNGAGKSSVLDSIMYALAGGASLPKEPVRRGAAKAKVTLDLGDIIVRRTFTAAGGSSLTVSNKDGLKYGSPQALLDGLTGKLTFDPLEFARQRPAQQAETLRALVGLDLTKLDQEYTRLYGERAVANAAVTQAEAALASVPKPAEDQLRIPHSVADVMKEMQEAAATNQGHAQFRARREGLQTRVTACCKDIDRVTLEIAQLEKILSGLEAEKKELDAQVTKLLTEEKAMKDIDLAPFQAMVKNMEAENIKVAQAVRYDELWAAAKAASQKADKLDGQVKANRDAREEAIRKAKFPVEGLGLGAIGVTLGGIPFEQCSSAEQLRVSVAIGIALNPKLKVLLCRDASVLDEDSLKLVADMAAKAGAQVWVERVETDGAVSVIIEDGHVKGQALPVADLVPEHETQTDLPPTKVQADKAVNAVMPFATEPPPEDDVPMP